MDRGNNKVKRHNWIVVKQSLYLGCHVMHTEQDILMMCTNCCTFRSYESEFEGQYFPKIYRYSRLCLNPKNGFSLEYVKKQNCQEHSYTNLINDAITKHAESTKDSKGKKL